MKSTNTKWFTLVELIIVITILAILATIAFISFQGYSQEARDSGKMSEVSELVKTIAIKEARENLDITASISWTTSGSWTLKLDTLGLNSENIYAIATSTWWYLIAAKMDKYDENQNWVIAISTGNYFIAGTAFLSGSTVLTSSGVYTNLEDFFGTGNLNILK